ncbi:Ribokinase-like protein [Martensiomyces pterosporus]|nr:Ribokinase-like protein [Martensiomyces pterosporus]
MPHSSTDDMNSNAPGQDHRSNDILCLAPNAAYQLTVLFDQITLGEVNRGAVQTNSLGGKGQNFAVATRQYYKSADRVTLLQILGGPTGAQIEAMEDEQGFDYITVKTSLPTRTCTTCLDKSTGEMTEMVGVSGVIDESAEAEYEQIARSILQSKAPPKALALCGTFPPGLKSTTVARMVAAKTDRTLVFVDAVKDIHPVLESKCIDILKVNSGEVISILSTLDKRYESKAPKDVDLAEAAMELGNRFSIGVVAVTDGPATAYLADTRESKCHAFTIPDLLADRTYFLGTDAVAHGHLVLNPLGAGDTCSAVLLNLLLDGKSIVEAFALGLAAASASCLVPMPNCVFDRKVMERIRGNMDVSLL